MARRSPDRDALEAEIDRIRSLGLDELRTLWRATVRSVPPPAFTRDLIVRSICWLIQEEALGGLAPDITKLLDSLAKGDRPGAERPQRLKAGTVLVREYQGERHTVTIVPGGYLWCEATYASLSTIARAITGTAWNGPRFFGLRGGVNRLKNIEGKHAKGHAGIGYAGRPDAGGMRRPSGSVSRLHRKVQR